MSAPLRPSASLPSKQEVTVGGWHIQSLKKGIVGEKRMQEIGDEVGDVFTLPEQLFGDSYLQLTHTQSGTVFRFNAVDALKGWKEEALPPLQVNAASQWRSAREEEIKRQGALILSYDWTFTTPYTGTAESKAGGAAADAGAEGDTSSSTADGASGVPWQETSEQIDRSLLMERDPILFYEEVPLYESDLDDFGVCQLGVKVRVMPKCWFVLLRFWLKVDNNLVRMRETRLFSRYDQPGAPAVVLKEVKHVEGTFQELRAAGAPADGPAYTDPDQAAAALSAVAPVGVVKFELHKLELGT